MANWWDGLVAPFAPAPISGYRFGDPLPAGGWTGNGQSYGWTKHLGDDFGTMAGETIIASGAADVSYRTGLPGYGNLLTEKLANGYELLFGHVASGVSGHVAAGAPIGVTGANVGSAKGSVTLLEVLDPSGRAINPEPGIAQLFSQKDPRANMPGSAVLGQPPYLPGSTQTNDPFGIGALAGSIAGIPTSIGHGLADAFVVGEQDIAEWLKRQAVAFFVAAVVLLVLFL